MIRIFLHIVLASTVSLSSSGFVIQKHYCQDELKEYSLYWKTSGCENHTKKKPACPFHPEPVSEEKGCCENETEIVKLEQAYTISSFDFSVFDIQHLVGPVIPRVKIGFAGSEIYISHFLTYKPPPLVRNFPVSLQTFLL